MTDVGGFGNEDGAMRQQIHAPLLETGKGKEMDLTGLKSRSQQGSVPLEILGENPFPCLWALVSTLGHTPVIQDSVFTSRS